MQIKLNSLIDRIIVVSFTCGAVLFFNAPTVNPEIARRPHLEVPPAVVNPEIARRPHLEVPPAALNPEIAA